MFFDVICGGFEVVNLRYGLFEVFAIKGFKGLCDRFGSGVGGRG